MLNFSFSLILIQYHRQLVAVKLVALVLLLHVDRDFRMVGS